MSAPTPNDKVQNEKVESEKARWRTIWFGFALVAALLLIVVLIVAGPFLGGGRAASRASRVEVPVPADMLVGGAGPLSAGSWLDLYASLPGDKGTPTPYSLVDLKVAALVGDSSVLLDVPLAAAPTLQAALLVKDVKFAYRLLPGTPTPTATPTTGPEPSATITPTLTPSPGAGQSYLLLDTGAGGKLDLAASWLATGPAQLVIVEKLELPPLLVQGQAEATPAALSVHEVSTYDVEVVAFVDKNHAWQGAYDDKTEKVLLQMTADQWAALARSLAAAETVWLIHLQD